ncbi:glycosyltransferase family 2 protein [Bacteroides thetaiotaomicron]|uniref:glycosyltransferase family 2 protein n=1 Tax=Bacteroides thetaiotaomicron TaxID=818 RepID=UPI0039C09371
MDNPKVSIIVPIYRVEEYIERCAESLFAQTFDDIEYIFVDDCSPDKSVEILQRTLEKYPHRKRLTRIERLSSTAGRPLFDDKGFNWPLVITRFIAIAMTGWMCMP